MGATKMQFYTEHQIEMARLCKSLGHPARIAIVENLIEHNQLNCNDLRCFIPLAQSSISRHLKDLFEAGVLGYNVIGNNSFYYINQKVLSHIIEYLTKINLNANQQIKLETIYYRPNFRHERPFFMRI